MEPVKKSISAIVLAATIVLASCEKEQLILIATESANDRFNQSEECNSMQPFKEINVNSNDYQIMTMADSHVEDGNTNNLDYFFNEAKISKPTAVVLDGDLANGRSDQYDEFQLHLPANDSLPIFFLAGNHDIYFNGWNQFYSRFGSSTYLFSVITPDRKDLYICLDTSGGTLGDCQMEWFSNTLRNLRSNYRHCIVFTHNNLFRARHTPSTNPMTEELQVLFTLFTKYHVEMVITGHDHKRDDSLFGITRYIQLDAIQDGKSQASFLKINIEGNKIAYTFVKL